MTPAFSWHDAYYSPLQNLWSLLVVPVAYLAWRSAAPTEKARAVVPAAAKAVACATLVFAIGTILDPIATGPIAKSPMFRDRFAATLIPFLFVYLGDLRVLFMAFAVAAPHERVARNLGRAAIAAAIVPVGTGILYGGLATAHPSLHGQWLWMIYEAGFLALSCHAGRRVLAGPRGRALEPAARAFLRDLFGYSAAYYALWLAADVLIVLAELELGWAVRMVPNQLYYAFWVPFVHLRFFSLPLAPAYSPAQTAPGAPASPAPPNAPSAQLGTAALSGNASR